ncbi:MULTISPECIES: phage tail protein [unclassified Streptomyces]|uniref:Phage tail protein n=1 Tax=Streptomyces millisiae TaxID=3075542 RepID=A0ABU2LYM1_9ACTN|nr:phage tail protein [Streptomyces sp. DSM 44918]MDT0322383.1 phage tail protein [Streptomyces sp. DSM 44918]
MSLQEADSLTSHAFALQIDGVQVEYLQEVSALDMEQDTIQSPQNSASGQPTISILPGTQKSGTCTVVRGMTESEAFTQWINQSLAGQMSVARKNASIVMLDYERNPVKYYHLRRAWCSKIASSTLKAGEAAIVSETVTIVFEELVIE